LLVFVVMASFSSLILLTWVFSLLHFVMLARDLLILLIFSKNQLFVSLILCVVCLLLISLISAPIFISLHLLALGLIHSCFSRSIRHIIRLFILEVSVFFLMLALIAINLPLSMDFAVFYRFC
jgi:hypothetical protein